MTVHRQILVSFKNNPLEAILYPVITVFLTNGMVLQSGLCVHGHLRQRGAHVRRRLPPQDGRLEEIHAPRLPRSRHALQHPEGKERLPCLQLEGSTG